MPIQARRLGELLGNSVPALPWMLAGTCADPTASREEGRMRFSIGHALGWGFYGRAYFGPTYRCRVDSTTLVRGGSQPGPSLARAAFMLGFLSLPLAIILKAIMAAR